MRIAKNTRKTKTEHVVYEIFEKFILLSTNFFLWFLSDILLKRLNNEAIVFHNMHMHKCFNSWKKSTMNQHLCIYIFLYKWDQYIDVCVWIFWFHHSNRMVQYCFIARFNGILNIIWKYCMNSTAFIEKHVFWNRLVNEYVLLLQQQA